jgi:hypothetical protein
MGKAKVTRLILTSSSGYGLMREDFSRHNPIHRWWGGTELTSDQLWRWSPTLIKP